MKKIVAILLIATLTLTGCNMNSQDRTPRRKTADEKSPKTDISKESDVEDATDDSSAVESVDVTTELDPETADTYESSEAIVTESSNDITAETSAEASTETTESLNSSQETLVISDDDIEYEPPEFNSLDDEELLHYIENQYYSDLEMTFDNEDYQIRNVRAIYLSKEYLEDVEYNSLENIYFGYKLSEVEESFGDVNYAFTLGDNNETIVEEFESYDFATEKMIRNVAIGSGVIIVLVVVTVATSGTDVPPVIAAVSAISGRAAKGAMIGAVSSGSIGAALGGAIEYYQGGDKDAALKAAALSGSEGFKTGAIIGAVTGGIRGAVDYFVPVESVQTWQASENLVLEKYGGETQVSYLNGELVSSNTPGATRPDLVRQLADGTKEAIEVKNYTLDNPNCLSELCHVLKGQIGNRVENLPSGMTQRIVLDVTGRGYSGEVIETALIKLHSVLDPIYPNIPIDVLGVI